MLRTDQTELLDRVAARFGALSDVSRLRLLILLREGPASVTALTARLSLAQAGVSKHLAVLRAAGLVESSRQKNHVIYRIADQRVFELCAVVCDGVFRQIRAQQSLLGELKPAVRRMKPSRQGART